MVPREIAAAALRKLGGTYITTHADAIAKAALNAANLTDAIENVRQLIGHTSVGRRRYAELAELARAAVGDAVSGAPIAAAPAVRKVKGSPAPSRRLVDVALTAALGASTEALRERFSLWGDSAAYELRRKALREIARRDDRAGR